MKKYAYVIDGKVARITNRQTEISGLCTDDFTTCSIIVLIAPDKTRYVLIHADSSFSVEMLQQQIEWVGKHYTSFIYHRRDVNADTFTKVLENLRYIEVSDDTESVSVYCGDEQPATGQTLPKHVVYHPKVSLLFAQHKTETLICSVAILNPLLFNDGDWTQYETFELSKIASVRLSFIGIQPQNPAYLVLQKLTTSQGKQFQDYSPNDTIHAAFIYCYLYFIAQKNDSNRAVFLQENFEKFLQFNKMNISECPVFIKDFFEHFNKLPTPSDMHKYTAVFSGTNHQLRRRDQSLKIFAIAQADVLLNACQLFFTKFIAPIDSGDFKPEENTFPIERIETNLALETSEFFKGDASVCAQWKKYPDDKLTGKYKGHQVRFFTMAPGTDEKAFMFLERLKTKGFDVDMRKAKDKPSIVADLSGSKCGL